MDLLSLSNKQTNEKWFVLFLLCVFASSFLGLSNAIVFRLPFIGELLGPYIDYVVQYVALIGSFRYVISKVRINDGCFYVILLVFYGLQYFIYPENQTYLNDSFMRSMVFAVPMYFIGLAWNVEKFDKSFFWICVMGIFWMFVYQLFINEKTISEMEEGLHQMAEAYETLFLTLYVTWYTFRKFSIFGLITITIGVFCMFAFGTRGPLIVFVSFVLLYSLIISNFKYKKYILSVAVVLSILFFEYFEIIMIGLDTWMNGIGLNTRITEQILHKEVMDDSADERILIINTLRNHLSGSGSSFGLFGSWRFVHTYAHRIYWDFWFNFGYIVGSIFLIILGCIYIKALKKTNHIERGFWMLLMCDAIITLNISDYFMFRGTFWLLLGFCIQLLRKENNIQQL